MLKPKELVEFCQKYARDYDTCCILARYCFKHDIVQKLEQKGYSRLSLRLSEAIAYPTAPGNKEKMQKILQHI